MSGAGPVPGSFRDPRGHVVLQDGRVLRHLSAEGVRDFEAVRATGLLDRLVAEDRLLSWRPVEPPRSTPGVAMVLEHPPLRLITYPYEWPFSALKAAALLHLDIQLGALEQDIALVDASAYNVQFDGPRPVFIDHLSFRPYRDGEFWLGHRQFLAQFLYPLLFTAETGEPFNAWYRGAPEGLPPGPIAALVPRWRRLTPVKLLHLTGPARLAARGGRLSNSRVAEFSRRKRLPKQAFRGLLAGLRRWIERLSAPGAGSSAWAGYSASTHLSEAEREAKRRAVAAFAQEARPGVLLDLGCNTGDYAAIALASGAGRVIGLEADAASADIAFRRATAEGLRFLPLCVDLADPSPAQGWAGREREDLASRLPGDGLLALALVHHLAIGRNVPLDQVVSVLVDLAPRGLIEFVPKSDPMVREMLSLREDVFDAYTEDAFRAALEARATVAERVPVGDSGRVIYRYERRGRTPRRAGAGGRAPWRSSRAG